jgi:drug/metabolite transporter (DMT)-like permease
MPISFGALAGLGAALSWGTMDIASALASRRLGSLKVTAGIQVVGAVLLVALALIRGTAFPSDPVVIVASGLLGIVGAGAYLAYFTGLRIGPISLVSGVVAAYGGLVVVLAVVIRGESLSSVQALGAAVATVGVVLTSVVFEGGLRTTRLAGPGVVFAVVALVCFAIMTVGAAEAIERSGWLEVLVISRIVNSIASIVAVVVLTAVAHPRLQAIMQVDTVDRGSRSWAIVLLAGTLDVTGLIVFAIGLELSETWLVGLVSSFGPAFTILIAVLFLGEHLRSVQWLGLSGVALGMVLIALP